MMFSYSEAVEVQRTCETAATPFYAEGANLSELYRTIRGLSWSCVESALCGLYLL